jgi:hypothetical protein
VNLRGKILPYTATDTRGLLVNFVKKRYIYEMESKEPLTWAAFFVTDTMSGCENKKNGIY